MQTTLRIDDCLYREAKAEAAREGVSLTRFIEEGLRLRLEKKSDAPAAPPTFRVFDIIDHGWRQKVLLHRIDDQRLVRLIGKWLSAGVMESDQWQPGE